MSETLDDRDRSIEELRRIVYARGSDPDAIRAAAEELERRAAIDAATQAAALAAAPARSEARALHRRSRVALIAGLSALVVVAAVVSTSALATPTVHTAAAAAAHTASPAPQSSPLHQPSPPTGELPDVFPSAGAHLLAPEAGGPLLATATSWGSDAAEARPMLSSTKRKLLVTVICRGTGRVVIELSDGQDASYPCGTTATTTRHEFSTPSGQFLYSVDARRTAEWALAIASAPATASAAAASTAASAAAAAADAAVQERRSKTPATSG